MKFHSAVMSLSSEITPWLNGNETFMLGGAFSYISYASSPIAHIFVLFSIAIIFFSFSIVSELLL